jgi:hypothetical protein
MSRLIGDLLDVVSMELGRLHVNASQQDATQLLAETMANFQGIADSHNLVMTCMAPRGPVPATFDHDRILQVLSNLVGNAIKFSEAGGIIELRLAPNMDGLEFTVRDSGRGITADAIEAIFESFSQAGKLTAAASVSGYTSRGASSRRMAAVSGPRASPPKAARSISLSRMRVLPSESAPGSGFETRTKQWCGSSRPGAQTARHTQLSVPPRRRRDLNVRWRSRSRRHSEPAIAVATLRLN